MDDSYERRLEDRVQRAEKELSETADPIALWICAGCGCSYIYSPACTIDGCILKDRRVAKDGPEDCLVCKTRRQEVPVLKSLLDLAEEHIDHLKGLLEEHLGTERAVKALSDRLIAAAAAERDRNR